MNSALNVKVQYSHPEATNITDRFTGRLQTPPPWTISGQTKPKLWRSSYTCSGLPASAPWRAELLASLLPFFWIHYHQISATLILLLSSNLNSKLICSEQPSLFNFSVLISNVFLLLFAFVKSVWKALINKMLCTIISSNTSSSSRSSSSFSDSTPKHYLSVMTTAFGSTFTPSFYALESDKIYCAHSQAKHTRTRTHTYTS